MFSLPYVSLKKPTFEPSLIKHLMILFDKFDRVVKSAKLFIKKFCFKASSCTMSAKKAMTMKASLKSSSKKNYHAIEHKNNYYN